MTPQTPEPVVGAMLGIPARGLGASSLRPGGCGATPLEGVNLARAGVRYPRLAPSPKSTHTGGGTASQRERVTATAGPVAAETGGLGKIFPKRSVKPPRTRQNPAKGSPGRFAGDRASHNRHETQGEVAKQSGMDAPCTPDA